MFNLNLAVRTLAEIEESYDQAQRNGTAVSHDQSVWGRAMGQDLIVDQQTGLPVGTGSCNTGMCFAGWGLSLSNVKLRWVPIAYGPDEKPTEFTADFTADNRFIPVVMSELLGIDYDQIRYTEMWDEDQDFPALYSSGNDRDDLYHQVSLLSGVDEATVRSMVIEERARLLAPLAKGVQLNAPA